MRSGADLNGDNLRISTAYLQISDHCRIVGASDSALMLTLCALQMLVLLLLLLLLGLGLGSGLELRLGLGLGLEVVVYKLLEKVTKCGSIT